MGRYLIGFGISGMYYLNLSHNYLEGIQEPYALPFNISILDLHSNHIHGKMPILPQDARYVVLSSNNFYSFVPVDTCDMYSLEVLDLSSNNLSGRIPECMSMIYAGDLKILNLGRNNFSGTIPDSFPVECGLRTLELDRNSMEGKTPKSMVNCTELQVLDLGNNHLIDKFPCFLNNISTLQVVIFRSNNFHGSIECSNAIDTSWSMLQIINLAHNNFSNQLPGPNFFTKLKATIFMEDNAQEKLNHLTAHLEYFPYYEVSTTITIKGQDTLLVKILTIDIFIDFSSNNFNGQIPEELGDLSSFFSLNLSSNAFSGPIPSSFGKLNSLESLDLSRNKLNGSIPTSLASLNFLSHLNLSFNKLIGRIPPGTQFQAFSANSFTGNEGLCGCPLTTNHTLLDHGAPPDYDKHHSLPSKSKEIDWNLISAE